MTRHPRRPVLALSFPAMLALLTLHGLVIADKPAPTADAVIATIRADGPRSIIASNDWFAVLDALRSGLERGDAKWAKVATLLRPATDAGSAMDLEIAVGRALPENPAMVLRLAETVIPLNDVCPPFFDEDEDRDVVLKYLIRAEGALVKLNAPELEEKRVVCLGNIRALKCDLTTCQPHDVECYAAKCRHFRSNPSNR